MTLHDAANIITQTPACAFVSGDFRLEKHNDALYVDSPYYRIVLPASGFGVHVSPTFTGLFYGGQRHRVEIELRIPEDGWEQIE